MFRPSYTVRCHTPTMGRSNTPAMHQNRMRCLRCIFQHVDNFAPDFGISQPLIVRFSIDLQYSNGHSIGFPVIHDSKLPIKYFLLPSQRWTLQENIETFHREKLTGRTATIFEAIPAMVCDVVPAMHQNSMRWFVMHFPTCWKSAHDLEYFSYLLSDFQAVFSKMKEIRYSFM